MSEAPRDYIKVTLIQGQSIDFNSGDRFEDLRTGLQRHVIVNMLPWDR
jgi:hypothetical protein